MKFIDCSACIGRAAVNRLIINHEDYPVYEKVTQPKNFKELLDEMDFCGVDEAVTWHNAMFDVAPTYGNKQFLSEKGNYTGRLHGTITVLPSISDKGHTVEEIDETVKKFNLVGLRFFPKHNRFMLDAITCGDVLDYCIEKGLPAYLSPMDDWEHIFAVMKEFPRLPVIITNYGLWGSDRYFYPLVKAYPNVYVDTSDFQEIVGIEAFVNKFGSERMLFGTNYPCDNMGGPIAMLMGSRISQEDKENIAHKNIERLFNGIGRSLK